MKNKESSEKISGKLFLVSGMKESKVMTIEEIKDYFDYASENLFDPLHTCGLNSGFKFKLGINITIIRLV